MKKSLFQKRRKKLCQLYPKSVFFFWSGKKAFRNDDVTYPFRVESSFFYLSGWKEADSWLVIRSDAQGRARTLLAIPPKDPVVELWEGVRKSPGEVQKEWGIQEVCTTAEWEEKLPAYLQGVERVFWDGRASFPREAFLALLQRLWKKVHRRIVLPPLWDHRMALAALRQKKDPFERSVIEKACQKSASAHKALMQWVRPGMLEREAACFLETRFYEEGMDLAYGSIVAAGEHALVLHYQGREGLLKEGELLLVDAGGEWSLYASDITRTFPVGKRFTAPQAELYELVLAAQKKAISLAREGATFSKLQKAAVRVLVRGLLDLGFFRKKSFQEVLERELWKDFFPHGIGHDLGLDVHDLGERETPFEEGRVITVEPGLYIPRGHRLAPSRFWGIGIRIEDDVWVSKKGPFVLTQDVPKERQDVEALRKEAFSARAF